MQEKWTYNAVSLYSGLVTMPSGKQAQPELTNNKDGTVTVRFQPSEAGQHELAVKCAGNHLPGSPFKFFVDQVDSGNVTAYGPGLTHGIAGEKCLFTINTREAGSGMLNQPINQLINCNKVYRSNQSINQLILLLMHYYWIEKMEHKNRRENKKKVRFWTSEKKNLSKIGKFE